LLETRISPFGRNDNALSFAPLRLGGRKFLGLVLSNILNRKF